MRTIGLIGGMSWESTRLYYDALNVAVRERLGGLHSARCILYSVDFAPIARMQANGDWEAAAETLVDAARSLERAGADCIGLCTNTMHKIADRIVAGVRIPFIHIAETTADAIKAAGMRRPYLMATRFTMEQDFYTGMLRARGLDVMVPDAAARAEVHRIIYDELCRGEIKDSSRATYVTQTRTAKDLGADCVILGCTEVGMLLSNENSALPTFDTTRLHALRLVDFALGHAAQQVR